MNRHGKRATRVAPTIVSLSAGTVARAGATLRARALARLGALLGAVVVVCGATSAAPEPPTLRVALTQEPGTLNPITGTLAVETDIAQLVFDGLIRYNERGDPVPDLAERVPTIDNGGIARDGRTITYHLVHNAHWHDGVPVTSADVAFTFAAIRNPNNTVAQQEPYDKIDRVETPDPYTVRLRLKRPWAPVIDAFRDGIGSSIIPAHLLCGLPNINHIDFNGAPVGSGPYRLVAWHRGSDMVLAANPDYFRGPPKIARIIVRYLSNDSTMMVALRTHEIDVADRLNVSTFITLGDIPGMVAAVNGQAYWEHLTFNTRHPPLDDRRVRQALCYGLDINELLTKAAHGLGVLGASSTNPLTRWYNKAAVPYPFDPDRARALLDRAGWKTGADGVRSSNGKRLSVTLSFPSGNITREQTAVILQQRWQSIGVETIIKTYPAATFFAPASSGGPFYGGHTDVALSAFIDAVPDPSRVAFNSADMMPPHGNNVSFFADPELTMLENTAASTPIFAARKALYDRIQLLEVRDVPYYVLRWQKILDMRSTKLTGVRPPIVSSTFWNVADWQFAQ